MISLESDTIGFIMRETRSTYRDISSRVVTIDLYTCYIIVTRSNAPIAFTLISSLVPRL